VVGCASLLMGRLRDLTADRDLVSGAGVAGWRLEQTYANLPNVFFAEAVPMRVQAPRIAILNQRLAAELGLDLHEVPDELAANWFAGQQLPPGAVPIAQAYAGHQYGGFTMLGDGRAILLGEQRTARGVRYDIQLKGAGQTRFSRAGDGRAALGPMLREYLISEAMVALGIPSTQSLAVVTTGEPVYRERTLRGAILTRVAASHIRVGTFQYLAARRDEPNLRLLADYTIGRHDPDLTHEPDRYERFLRAVVNRQAALIAQWQLVGFVHGVMNTDNMAVSGETIDYGPCAFLDTYHPDTVFSSIDHGGRYAYGNQPRIGQWNLARFAETLIPLLDSNQEQAIERAVAILEQYVNVYDQIWLEGMRKKLGLSTAQPDDADLIHGLLEWMQDTHADFTNTFRRLSEPNQQTEPAASDARLRAWLEKWRDRLAREGQSELSAQERMRMVNPCVIPRNHRVEEALMAATDHDDYSPLRRLLNALTKPFTRTDDTADLASPPPPNACRYRTFCGT
jgi:uncharacterized protein YdiU (UPF0061 family)